MKIQVSGVPGSVRPQAEGLIRGVLGPLPREGTLHVHATRFANGEWVVFITDLHEVEIMDGEVADRIRLALRTLPPI